MSHFPVFAVSGSSNEYGSLGLLANNDAEAFLNQLWGSELSKNWRVPDFIRSPKSRRLPVASITSAYIPGLLVATPEAAEKLRDPLIEELPARVEGKSAILLNARYTIHRFREEGSDVLRVPDAVILLRAANFYAQDVPSNVHLFWLHDGNFPRFLLCTERFVDRVRRANLSGLTFTQLGFATDA